MRSPPVKKTIARPVASHGDPDAIEVVERLTGEKVNVRKSSYRSLKGKSNSEQERTSVSPVSELIK